MRRLQLNVRSLVCVWCDRLPDLPQKKIILTTAYVYVSMYVSMSL
ncbi:hypothetical protein [Microcoleus sp. T3_A4]